MQKGVIGREVVAVVDAGEVVEVGMGEEGGGVEGVHGEVQEGEGGEGGEQEG